MEYRLLVVEDEKRVRIALRKAIEKLNLPIQTVHEASDGMHAAKVKSSGVGFDRYYDAGEGRMDALARYSGERYECGRCYD